MRNPNDWVTLISAVTAAITAIAAAIASLISALKGQAVHEALIQHEEASAIRGRDLANKIEAVSTEVKTQ